MVVLGCVVVQLLDAVNTAFDIQLERMWSVKFLFHVKLNNLIKGGQKV